MNIKKQFVINNWNKIPFIIKQKEYDMELDL